MAVWWKTFGIVIRMRSVESNGRGNSHFVQRLEIESDSGRIRNGVLIRHVSPPKTSAFALQNV